MTLFAGLIWQAHRLRLGILISAISMAYRSRLSLYDALVVDFVDRGVFERRRFELDAAAASSDGHQVGLAKLIAKVHATALNLAPAVVPLEMAAVDHWLLNIGLRAVLAYLLEVVTFVRWTLIRVARTNDLVWNIIELLLAVCTFLCLVR